MSYSSPQSFSQVLANRREVLPSIQRSWQVVKTKWRLSRTLNRYKTESSSVLYQNLNRIKKIVQSFFLLVQQTVQDYPVLPYQQE